MDGDGPSSYLLVEGERVGTVVVGSGPSFGFIMDKDPYPPLPHLLTFSSSSRRVRRVVMVESPSESHTGGRK